MFEQQPIGITSDVISVNANTRLMLPAMLLLSWSPSVLPDEVQVTTEMLEAPPAADWLMWRRTPDAWAYSPLEQISRENVGQLSRVWARAMEPGPQQATPLIHGGIMYLPHAGNVVQALDARTGDLLWEYRRDSVPKSLMGILTALRHLAIYEDKIFLATLDAHLVALDAQTGDVVWDHKVADYRFGYRYNSGAMVFDGKVVAGISGCTTTAPGGCFVSAHDPDTGEELWRVHSLPQARDPGEETWAGRPVEKRWGGSMWQSGSYDPETKMIFWGTGVPVPYGEAQRGGIGRSSALYTNSTLAIDADTGKRMWFRQHLPSDNWDMDHVYERYVVDRIVGDATRRTVVGIFGKLGIVRALDAVTGDHLWSRETIFQNLVTAIDPDSGNPTLNESLIPDFNETVNVCPSNIGGKNWNAGAYHPDVDAIFVAQNQTCMEFLIRKIDESTFSPGVDLHFLTSFAKTVAAPGKSGKVGRIDAISATTGEILWTHEQAAPWTGALLTTAGGLLIGGDAVGRLKAFDVESGEPLWESPLSAAITGFPVSYEVDGRQYIAVPVGGGTILDFELSQLVQSNSLPEASSDLPSGRNVLIVFALPE